MSETLKNRPKTCFKESSFSKWFEGFEKKHGNFYCSSYLVENWLVDNELSNTPEVAHAIRVFIMKVFIGGQMVTSFTSLCGVE